MKYMKNIIKWGLAAIPALAILVACTGHPGEVSAPIEKVYSLVLKADTYAIVADNSDEVFFTVTLDGEDITSHAEIVNVATEEALPVGTASFKSATVGEVSFVVVYEAEDEDGMQELTSNTQTIKVIAEGTAKKFYRNCGIVRFTGTWCAPCYTLGQTFNRALEKFPDRTVVVMAHVNNPASPDPYINDAAKAAEDALDGANPPSVNFDFRDRIAGAQVAESVIISHLNNSIVNHPADCGISAASTITGNTATIDVEITATSTKEYFITVALIEDGIVGSQRDGNSQWINGYTHNNTLRSFGETSLYGVPLTFSGDTATKSLTYDLTGYEAANCRFAIWVTYREGDRYFIDNAAYCPAGKSIRYAYDA